MKVKSFLTSLFIISVLVIAASLPVIVAKAAPAFGLPVQEAQPAPVDFVGLLDSLKNLVGVGALIAALVNAGKSTGLVKDGQAGTWSAGLNIAALIGLLVAQSAGYANLVPAIDTQAGGLATVMTVVLAYVVQLIASRKTHDAALAGLPLIGSSHSGRTAGESISVVENVVVQ